ncbi:MAG TPA: hypothetical protein VMF03_13665 [Steroidobacteraceae bacterium]|nr:hypothetical protein [Steroidobacteraceae bacterium]
MSRRSRILISTLAVAGTASSAALAADDSGMGKDLAATIALQGMPCDKVVESKRNGDSDYTATCKDGNRYHVYVDRSGRVVVQKL